MQWFDQTWQCAGSVGYRMSENALISAFAVRSLFAGNLEVPTSNAQVIKMPVGTYEFGANLISHAVRQHANYYSIHVRWLSCNLRCDRHMTLQNRVGQSGRASVVVDERCAACCAGQHDGRQDPHRRQSHRPCQVSSAVLEIACTAFAGLQVS